MSMEPIPFLIFRKVLQYTIMLHWINYGFHDMSILDQVQPKFIYSSYGVRFPSGLSSCAAYSTHSALIQHMILKWANAS